jgi:UDP-3-O-[3-hydroxymyristoyl] glucosamine N-acyltransferase
LDKAGPEDLSFCNLHGEIATRVISASNAGVVICFDDIAKPDQLGASKCIMMVENPRLAFIHCLKQYFRAEIEWGIHPTAMIEANVALPHKVKVGPSVYIGAGTSIGEQTILEYRVFVGPGTKIGRNVYVQPGAVIGCEGQGFERNAEGVFEKFPQSGWVVIEDDVEIGANSTVVRGTFYETRIGQGSKIGHLTDIGHNVNIGKHVFVSACVIIGGSAIIGDYSWLAPGTVIRDSVKVGKNVKVSLGSVVTKSIKDNQILMGIPARSREKFLRELKWIEKNIGVEE